MTVIITIAIVALGVLILLSKLRKPPPPGTPLNPEDRNLDFYRRLFPDPSITRAQAPKLEDLHLDFRRRRKEEEELADTRRALDSQHGIGAPTTPPSQPPPNA